MGKELFDNIPSKVSDLLTDVKNGKIGLPDLQRPFVWKDAKVRDLLDSMLKGYPIGYVMLWSSPEDYENATYIGENGKIYRKPTDLVIDGQQRLTALLAALYGVPVKDANYKERRIRISFNPLSREFAVWTQACENDSAWISDISTAFLADDNHDIYKFQKSFIKSANNGRAKKGNPALTEDEEGLITGNINDLLNLGIYSLPTLKISTRASEEAVADVFVRVNSGGQNLTEKNFIETLIAVYDNDASNQIDQFCAASRLPTDGTSYNQILAVDPGHLIRMAVGVGFKRARLRYAYLLLRGKDLKTGEVTKETRAENLAIFKNALDRVTNLNNWHDFLNLFTKAGYLKGNLVSSSNAVVFSYVLYLIGKDDYNVPSLELQKIITKWIFMATITGFYTGSAESEVEKQFADLRTVKTADAFIAYLNDVIESRFTDDYFAYTLVNDLTNSSAVSPAWYGYIASLNVLGTPMLFSTAPLSHYFTVGTSGNKNAIDKHHIFPKHYLETIDFTDDRDRNQIANFTYLDYATNIDISDEPPTKYASRYREKLGEEKFRLTCAQNAIPENFDTLAYPEFLAKRRVLMAQIVQKAYKELCK